MHQKNTEKYWILEAEGRDRHAQKLAKGCFHSFIHDLAGERDLLHLLIKHPTLHNSSAEQPARFVSALTRCIKDWEASKQTRDYKKTKKCAESHYENHRRPNQQMWSAKRNIADGQKRKERAAAGQWKQLTASQQKRWKDRADGTLEHKPKQLEKKKSR